MFFFLSNLGVLEASSATLRGERGTPWLPAYRMVTQRDGQPFILKISPTASIDSPVTPCMSSDCRSKPEHLKRLFTIISQTADLRVFQESVDEPTTHFCYSYFTVRRSVFFCHTFFRHCWLVRVKTENQTSAVVRLVIPLVSEGRKAWWNGLKGVNVTKLYWCWIQKEKASCEIRKNLKKIKISLTYPRSQQNRWEVKSIIMVLGFDIFGIRIL